MSTDLQKDITSNNGPLQNSWYCVFVLLTISLMGTGLLSNALVIMNPITPVIKQRYSEIFQDRYGAPMSDSTWTLLLSLTMSLTYIGGLFGSLLVNPLLRRFTRKQVTTLVYAVNAIGLVVVPIGATVANSHEMVICGRFITGVSLGLGFAIFPLLVNEFCVPNKRLHYGAVYGVLFGFTAGISTFIAWPKILGSYENYVGALAYGLLYPLVYFVSMHWILETPYQAALKNDKIQALQILKKLRCGLNREHDLQLELQALLAGHVTKCEVQSEATWREIFTIPQYRRHFFGVVIVSGYQTACGISNVLSFSNKIFEESGLPKDAITPASIGLYGVAFINSIIVVVAMRKFDPRMLILCGSAVLAVSHAMMTASAETFHRVPAMCWVSMAAMWIFMAGFSTVKTMVFGVIGVLCIDRTRSKCFMVGSALFWFLGWLVGFIAPYLTVWIQGYSFLVWMTITLLLMVYVFFCMPKTKQKSEVEIQAFYKK